MIGAIVEQFIRRALDYLERAGAPTKWEPGEVHEVTAERVSFSHPSKPDFGTLVMQGFHFERAFDDLIERLENDATFAAFGEFVRPIPNFGVWSVPRNVLPWLLNDHLFAVPSLEPNDEIVKLIASNFELCVKDRIFGDYLWCPVEGFTSALDEIDCGAGIFIRRCDPTRMLRLLARAHDDQLRAGRLWPFALERKSIQKIGVPTNEPHAYISAVVRSLRLLRSGPVSVRLRSRLPYDLGYIRGGFDMEMHASPLYQAEYEFLEAFAIDFRKLVEVVLREKFDKAVKIAVDRVVASQERPSKEDNFIDHVIALEALFGDNTDGLPGGLNFKICMRLAMFMFDSSDARKVAMSMSKDAMKLRGKLVHGDAAAIAPGTEGAVVVDWVEKTTRAALQHVLLELPTFTPKMVDEVIFTMVTPGAVSALS